MHCDACGKKNRKDAAYCNACGKKLCKEALELEAQYHREAPEVAVTRARARAVVWAVIAVALLISAVSFAASPYGFGKEDGGNRAADADNQSTGEPYPTLLPIEFLKPTPKPTRVPHTQLPRPTGTPPAIVKPTARPILTPLPPPSTTTPSPNEANPDRAPIDALCSFILYGGASYAREAFPPEYLQYEIDSYGFAIGLIGGEDAAIELVGEMIIQQLEEEYGVISNMVYIVEKREEMTAAQLEGLCRALPNYGMTIMPSEAHALSIKVNIVSQNGAFALRITPRVLLIDGKWYIHPADIDIATA